MEKRMEIKRLRLLGIEARNSLSKNEREELSQRAVENILASPEFAAAKTVMLYRAIRGELDLSALAELAPDKIYLYPLCVSSTEMIALHPGEGAWKRGYCGIEEPVPENSDLVGPEEIDMLICPCTAFDEAGGRIGMGAGFYDRYLPKCVNACKSAAAFEAQRAERIPMGSWDQAMELVYTEKRVLRPKERK